MKFWMKWACIALGGALCIGVAGIAVLYAWSETIVGRTYQLPAPAFHARVSPDAIARGEHLTQIVGCIDCHKRDLTGALFDDVPGSAVWSRNLHLAARTFSDADFDRAIRHGLHADGTSVFIMPSDVYTALRDDELSDIVAYLRSLPPKGIEHPSAHLGLRARLAVLRGDFRPDRGWLDLDKPALDLGPATAKGRHLASIACAECHDTTLDGVPDPTLPAPNLSLVASYSREDFAHFMRTGKAAGNRELPVMSAEARLRFAHFTDDEVNEIYDYLAARGHKLAESGQ
jgi:cytochrome c553